MNARILAFAALVSLGALGCPRSSGTADAAPPGVSQPLPPDAAPPARSPEIEDLWTRARPKDAGPATEDDLARLARREGVAGLIERGAHPDLRAIAARAMAHTDGFSALDWLAEVAADPDPVTANAALESAVTLASQRRHQVDPDDAEEIRAACTLLLALAKDPNADRHRRILAVRTLRQLDDRGCAKPADIPTDLDTHPLRPAGASAVPVPVPVPAPVPAPAPVPDPSP